MYPYPVEERVAELKKEFPSAIVYDIQGVEGQDCFIIVSRPLRMNEVSLALEIYNRNSFNGEEWVFTTSFYSAHSLLYDCEVDKSVLPFGTVKQNYNIVMEVSSMMDLPPFLDELTNFRNIASSLFYEAAKFIMQAFTQYKLKELKELTRVEFAELIMLAEKVHQSPFEIIDPSTMPTKEKQDKKLIRKIKEEAKINDNYLDFGKENKELERVM